MHTIDPDIGQSITYSIILGNENGEFYLDPSSGILFVANSAALNYNLNPVYSLIVEAMDNGQGNLIDMALINVLLIESNGSDNISNQNNDVINQSEDNGISSIYISQTEATVYEISLYPNPTCYFLNIDMSNGYNEKYTVNIYSLFGEMIKEIEFSTTPGNKIMKIDVSDLLNGTYILQLNSERVTERKKFLKL